MTDCHEQIAVEIVAATFNLNKDIVEDWVAHSLEGDMVRIVVAIRDALAAAERRGAEAQRASDLAKLSWSAASEQSLGFEDTTRVLNEVRDAVRAAPLATPPSEPVPMTGPDVLRIFRPAPPEEADALHFALGTADDDAAAADPAPAADVRAAESRLYVASRASIPARGRMWRQFRFAGWPIISTWIDEDGPGETSDWSALWRRIGEEIASCTALVLYAEPEDVPLKGAFVEAGMALALGKPVHVCAWDFLGDTAPLGSWMWHPLVRRHHDITRAMAAANEEASLGRRLVERGGQSGE